MTGFAHASDDDTAFDPEAKPAGRDEGFVQSRAQLIDSPGFDLQDGFGQLKQFFWF
jgi:hypothetical protein